VPRVLLHPFRFAIVVHAIVIAALVSFPASPAHQAAAPSGGLTIPALAQALTVELQKHGVWRVLILDLEDPDKNTTPFGVWLADQLAASIEPPLEVVDRKSSRSFLDRLRAPGKNEFDTEATEALAKSLNAVVTGSYSGADNGLGVSLRFGMQSGVNNTIYEKLAMTDEIKSHLTVPLELLVPTGGIFRGGEGGVTLPRCQHCPNPRYTKAASNRRVQGTVVLSVVIDAKGHVSDAFVYKKLDPDLDRRAVEAVRGWNLNPAMNVDGRPVSCRVPIEVTFRLY
jgi:TonB family protein